MKNNISFSVKTVWHCCDLEIQSRSLKVYERVKLNEYYHHEKFDIYHIYGIWENRNFKVFGTYEHSAYWPNTDHCILTFFMCVKNELIQLNFCNTIYLRYMLLFEVKVKGLMMMMMMIRTCKILNGIIPYSECTMARYNVDIWRLMSTASICGKFRPTCLEYYYYCSYHPWAGR